MDAKEFYRQKLLLLAAGQRHIAQFRQVLSDLSTLEERQPSPDHGPLYELCSTLDLLEELTDGLADEVEPMAE